MTDDANPLTLKDTSIAEGRKIGLALDSRPHFFVPRYFYADGSRWWGRWLSKQGSRLAATAESWRYADAWASPVRRFVRY